MQQLLPAQPRACSCLLTFWGHSGQTLMAPSQNTQPQEGCSCWRDLTQIKASQTQGFPSFSAGISLPCMPWPWDTALASLTLAAFFSPGREAREDQDCLKRMGNPWTGQHSWKLGRPLERSLT